MGIRSYNDVFKILGEVEKLPSSIKLIGKFLGLFEKEMGFFIFGLYCIPILLAKKNKKILLN